MTKFDLVSWHSIERDPDVSWGKFLGLGDFMLDQDEDTLLHVFPQDPELSHIAVKLLQGSGQWLACFDPRLIQQAWEGGMTTFLHPNDTAFANDRALGALASLRAGRYMNEDLQIVAYPQQDAS
jgi:hypothetical protein